MTCDSHEVIEIDLYYQWLGNTTTTTTRHSRFDCSKKSEDGFVVLGVSAVVR